MLSPGEKSFIGVKKSPFFREGPSLGLNIRKS